MNIKEALVALHTMNKLPLPLTDNSLFIDASAFERYTTCRRSFEYYFLHRRETAGKRSALTAGGIFHSVIECRRRLESTTALANVEKLQEELIHLHYAGWSLAGPAITNELKAYLKEQHGNTDSVEPEKLYPGFSPDLDDFRTESHMINVIRLYNKQYPVEPFDLMLDDAGKPIVEASFAFPLVALSVPQIQPAPISVYWTGRIDLPTLWPIENGKKELWNSDVKTSSRDMGFDEYANDQAQIGYLWALRKSTGLTPTGFMIDQVLWRPATKTGKGCEFKRHKERISAERIDEWETNTIAICKDILADYVRSFFPMESKWCVGKFGPCPYLDVCKLNPAARPLLLQSSFYTDVTWSPLRKG